MTVLDGGEKFLSHISWEWKFVVSASSPPSSSQWHWKGEEKITKHKLRERRRGFRWKSSWCSPTRSPLLALALLAEGLPGFYLISASEPLSLRCGPTYMTLTAVASASQTLCFSKLQKSSSSISSPCGELSSRQTGLVEDYEQWRVEDSFSRKTNYLNVCRPKLRF